MRLAISGTHSMGKTTLLNDCGRAFSDFAIEAESYRSLVAFNRDLHIALGAEADKHAMWILQGDLMGKLLHYRPGEKVFFDRGPVDMLAYSMYAMHFGSTDIDQAFLDALEDTATIYCREFLDAILFVGMTDDYAISFEDDGVRPTDDGYRETVDRYFKELYARLDLGLPVISINGPRESRIEQIRELLASERLPMKPALVR